MNVTLLLDLDDTLLINDFDEFLPHYLDAFSNTVAPLIEPDVFVRALMKSTQVMFNNRQPDCTLMEVFDSSFYPSLGIKKGEFESLANRFYEDVFPNLKSLTRAVPEAIELVNAAHDRGYSVSISTNPLFPITAIEQRLDWANLSTSEYEYDLISSFESFHFTKPDPTYFAEVLAQLGWPDGPIIVVGDDLERDIHPAKKLGLATFWVNRNGVLPAAEENLPTSSGDLSELLDWIETTPSEDLEPEYSTYESLLSILRGTPAAMDTISRGLSESIWHSYPFEGEWSLTEIMCHLRDVDREVNQPRINQILEDTDPFMSGVDTDQWAIERKYYLKNGKKALHEFVAARINIINTLENLDQNEWMQPARHAIFGPTKLVELVSIIAAHDRLHLGQINRILKAF